MSSYKNGKITFTESLCLINQAAEDQRSKVQRRKNSDGWFGRGLEEWGSPSCHHVTKVEATHLVIISLTLKAGRWLFQALYIWVNGTGNTYRMSTSLWYEVGLATAQSLYCTTSICLSWFVMTSLWSTSISVSWVMSSLWTTSICLSWLFMTCLWPTSICESWSIYTYS